MENKPQNKKTFGINEKRSIKNFSGDRPKSRPFEKRDGDKKTYGQRSDKPFEKRDGDKKPYGQRSDRPFEKRDGDKKPYGQRSDRPFEKRDGDKKSYGQRSDRPFEKRDGDKKPYGQRSDRPFEKRDGDKKPYGQRNDRPFEQRSDRTVNNPNADSGGLLSRLSAFRVIQDITVRNAYTSLALNNVLKSSSLSDTDKRLVTSIVYNTIENLIKIDYLIDFYMQTPTQEPVLRDVLRLSVAQILFLDRVPDFAAINEGVKLIKIVSTVEPWSGVVNGVLRNIVRNKEEFQWPSIEEDFEKYLSIMYSMPMTLVNRIVNTFGKEKAQDIISYKNTNNTTCIRPNLMHISIEKFEELLKTKGWTYEKGLVNNAYLIKGIESIAEDPDYIKGDFSVQGQSSMLAVEALENKLGMYVLDACAAPGGKTCYLAEKQNGAGRIYAWDIHPHRVELIRNQMYRTNPGNIRVAQCDATIYREDLFEFFDAVLIDAPCSNLGVMYDKPDVKYGLNEEEMENLLSTQGKILENCAKYLKLGGTLIYSTCSILPEENQEQVKKFLAQNGNFKMQKLPQSIPASLLEQEGELGLQIFSHKTGLEGFYIAKMKKDIL